jgi:hypothetical protein
MQTSWVNLLGSSGRTNPSRRTHTVASTLRATLDDENGKIYSAF